MTIRKFALAAATLAVLSPALGNASSQKVSAKACASAFATRIATPGSVPAYKVTYRTEAESALAAFYPTDRTFALEARDPKTGGATARALCTTDANGTVKEISAVPLDSKAFLSSEF